MGATLSTAGTRVTMKVGNSNAEFSTSSTSYVDVTNVTLTYTESGAPIFIQFSSSACSASTGSGPYVQIQEDGAAMMSSVMSETTASSNTALCFGKLFTSSTGGSRTIKAVMKVGAGTGYLNQGGAAFTALSLIEFNGATT